MKNRLLEGLKRVKMNISGWATKGEEEVHERGVKATKKKAFGRAEGERWTFVCCHAVEVRDCESVTYKDKHKQVRERKENEEKEETRKKHTVMLCILVVICREPQI